LGRIKILELMNIFKPKWILNLSQNIKNILTLSLNVKKILTLGLNIKNILILNQSFD